MPKTYLTEIDFSAPASENSCGAHIAYTFDFQGGAASGYNKPLMFKGQETPSINFEKLESLEKLGEDVTELRKSYVGQLMSLISDAINKKFNDGWDWISVIDADFDAGIAIFCSDKGIFSVAFTLDDLLVTVEDVAHSVVETTDYEVTDETVLISVDFFDNMVDAALSDLVKSSLKHSHVKDLLIKAKNNSVSTEIKIPAENPAKPEIKQGEIPLDTPNKEDFLKSAEFAEMVKAAAAAEVQKAVDIANQEAQKEIEKARKEAEDLRKAEKLRIEEDYTSVVKSYTFVEEETAVALVKTFVENAELAELVVKTLDKAAAEIKAVKAEFSTEVGVEARDNTPVAKSSSELIRQKANAIKAQRAGK